MSDTKSIPKVTNWNGTQGEVGFCFQRPRRGQVSFFPEHRGSRIPTEVGFALLKRHCHEQRRSQRRGVLVGTCTGEEKSHLTPPIKLDSLQYFQLALWGWCSVLRGVFRVRLL